MSNIHIADSYKVSKHSFEAVLATKQDAEAQEVKAHRSTYSLKKIKRELNLHNALIFCNFNYLNNRILCKKFGNQLKDLTAAM